MCKLCRYLLLVRRRAGPFIILKQDLRNTRIGRLDSSSRKEKGRVRKERRLSAVPLMFPPYRAPSDFSHSIAPFLAHPPLRTFKDAPTRIFSSRHYADSRVLRTLSTRSPGNGPRDHSPIQRMGDDESSALSSGKQSPRRRFKAFAAEST